MTDKEEAAVKDAVMAVEQGTLAFDDDTRLYVTQVLRVLYGKGYDHGYSAGFDAAWS